MFRSSPLEELEERLSRLRAALDEKARLATRLRKAGEQRAQLEAEIAAARKRVAREALDVERFEAGGLITQLYEALNLADSKLEKERRELLAATLRLEAAETALVLLGQDTAGIEARLNELAGVEESYRKALAERAKWLDDARHILARFYEEVADVRNRIEGSARTLRPKPLWQLLAFFDDFIANWLEKSQQRATIDAIAGLRARIGSDLGQLAALRQALASPGAVADIALRDLDRIYGE